MVDKFAAVRTERAIERSDICILVMDASQGITTQEKRIAEQIEEAGKSCILLLNKWDLVKGFRMEHCLQGVRQEASFLSYCPTLFVSALSGRNLQELFTLILKVYEASRQRITTGQLNKFTQLVFQKYHPPMIQGKRLRVYYMTQVQVAPPRFLLFVNFPELMLETYKKYMIHQFREQYDFTGVPLIFDLKGKGGRHEHEQKDQSEVSEIVVSEEASSMIEESFQELPDLQEEFDSSYFQ